MPFNFDQEYKLNQIRRQQKIADAQRERDIREANGIPDRRRHEWLNQLVHFVKGLGAAWTTARHTHEDAPKRLGPTLKS